MVLLDLLSSNHQLIVAHFDHGIREASAQDRRFVEQQAKNLGLPFVYDEGELGAGASEAEARRARYRFLHKIRKSSGARAVVVAHHQDDLLETMLINLLRGTGRRGLSSLRSRTYVKRPLLGYTKEQLIAHANQAGLVWREDLSNQDTKYLRNYLRARVMPKLDATQRQKLLGLAAESVERNDIMDALLINLLHLQDAFDTVSRPWFSSLPHDVSKEFLAHWLRHHGVVFDTRSLERLAVQLKTLSAGSLAIAAQGWYFELEKQQIRLTRR